MTAINVSPDLDSGATNGSQKQTVSRWMKSRDTKITSRRRCRFVTRPEEQKEREKRSAKKRLSTKHCFRNTSHNGSTYRNQTTENIITQREILVVIRYARTLCSNAVFRAFGVSAGILFSSFKRFKPLDEKSPFREARHRRLATKHRKTKRRKKIGRTQEVTFPSWLNFWTRNSSSIFFKVFLGLFLAAYFALFTWMRQKTIYFNLLFE